MANHAPRLPRSRSLRSRLFNPNPRLDDQIPPERKRQRPLPGHARRTTRTHQRRHGNDICPPTMRDNIALQQDALFTRRFTYQRQENRRASRPPREDLLAILRPFYPPPRPLDIHVPRTHRKTTHGPTTSTLHKFDDDERGGERGAIQPQPGDDGEPHRADEFERHEEFLLAHRHQLPVPSTRVPSHVAEDQSAG